MTGLYDQDQMKLQKGQFIIAGLYDQNQIKLQTDIFIMAVLYDQDKIKLQNRPLYIGLSVWEGSG